MLAASAGAAVLGAGGWAALRERGETGPTGRVVLATGNTKGVYYVYGTTLAAELERRAPGVRAAVAATTGSVDNLLRLADGRATLAFAAGDAVAEAYQGRPPFERRVAVAAVARVYDDYIHLVVPAGSPVRSVADLAGRRVSLGSPGSGTALIAERLLAVAGLPVRRVTLLRLGINESVAALHGGRADAFFWSGGLPTAGVEELARATPIRLVALGEHAEPMRRRFGSAYRSATVPAGTYGGAERVAPLAVPNVLLCRQDADRVLVRALTRTLFDTREALARTVPQAEALDERAAVATFPVPLHPGAADYFRAVKR